MAKNTKTKKIFNMAYGLGASVVIIGALFKLTHYHIGPLTGGLMLTIGLVTEAIIFAISAFEPIDDDLDWSLVYPELTGGSLARDKDSGEVRESQSLLSQKLDTMLKEAKLDAKLIQSLGESIQNFKGAAENLTPVTDSIAESKRYGEQISLAATNMESLNYFYQAQLDSATRQNEINDQVAVNAQKLKEQMESMATNLSSLNGVYGGMLSAMSIKN